MKMFIQDNALKIAVTLVALPLIIHWGLFGILVIGFPLSIWWSK